MTPVGVGGSVPGEPQRSGGETRDPPPGERVGTGPRPPKGIEVVAFDGDDTLWHNESIFSVTHEKFRRLLAPHVGGAGVDEALFATETRNLGLFGYGVKGFTLSMIETAIEVSGGRVTAAEVQTILDAGKAMLGHPVELLDGVAEAVEALAGTHRLMLVTKGDLFDQESKLARSGLAEAFWKVEIVSEKDERTYRRILDAHGVDPEAFVMVGNSVRSDVLPAVAVGARAVHVPYHLTWAHEVAEVPEVARGRCWQIADLGELAALLERIEAG